MFETLYLRQELKQVWPESEVFDQVEALQGEVYRALANRRTLRVSINKRFYFVKIHSAVGWTEIFKNLFTLRMPVVGALNEYQACLILKSAGLRVPAVAGFGIRGFNPAARESFIISDAVEPSISLEDFCAAWSERKPETAIKHQLIDQVANMTRILHAQGLNHRDLYICHFLLDKTALQNAEYELTLIDLHRAQKRRRVPRRWLVKDLGSLLFSSMDIGLQKKDWFRFIVKYTQAPLEQAFHGEQAIFWRDVHLRALHLYRQENPDAV